MRLSRIFIDRPIFAAVIAIVITLVGAISYFGLPVSQYPDVVPPTITVSASYPGASAETVADTGTVVPACAVGGAVKSRVGAVASGV